MTIIAFANQKGGVGKTTSTAACGHALAELGHRVLVIDLDPQSSLTISLGLTPGALEHTVYDLLRDDDASLAPDAVLTKTAIENLDLIPSNIDLASAETELVGQLNREGALRGARAMVQGYEFI